MPSKRGIIGKDGIVADNTIMRHMRCRKEQPIVTDGCFHRVDGGTRMHRHMFADNIVRADLQRARLPLIARVLRWTPQYGKGIDLASRPNTCPPLDHHMAAQPHAIAKLDIATNDAERANLDITAKCCPGVDNSCRVNAHTHRLVIRIDDHCAKIGLGNLFALDHGDSPEFPQRSL